MKGWAGNSDKAFKKWHRWWHNFLGRITFWLCQAAKAMKLEQNPFLDSYVVEFLNLPDTFHENDFRKALVKGMRDYTWAGRFLLCWLQSISCNCRTRISCVRSCRNYQICRSLWKTQRNNNRVVEENWIWKIPWAIICYRIVAFLLYRKLRFSIKKVF